MTITLPARFHGRAIFPFLSQLAEVDHATDVQLDFGQLRRITPAGLVALTTTVKKWRGEGKSVAFENLEQCSITGYLQRMDFLQACGAAMPELFRRHDARGKFIPVRLVDVDIDAVGDEIATCLAPGGDEWDHPHAALYSLAYYVFTEMGNNVRQHSRGIGYTAAQVNGEEGLVRIAIGDNGRGIRQSFVDVGLDWARTISDSEAILRALEPKISSKGPPENQGVGLTMVSGLVRETQGWLLVISGSGIVTQAPGKLPVTDVLPRGTAYAGTLVVTVFRQSNVVDFAKVLTAAKVQAGLLRPIDHYFHLKGVNP